MSHHADVFRSQPPPLNNPTSSMGLDAAIVIMVARAEEQRPEFALIFIH
jgi:hypothetical protein